MGIYSAKAVSSRGYKISNPGTLFVAWDNGNVGNTAYISEMQGFRPIVCLKSDVQLKANESSGYIIQE